MPPWQRYEFNFEHKFRVQLTTVTVLLFFILPLSSIGICGAQHSKDTFLREQ